MRRNRLVASVALGLAVALTAPGAATRNLAPDAVSRASTWNQHEGEVAWLTDGLAPPASASAFVWFGRGILAFEWGQVLPLSQVRVRAGAADADFEVRTYIGGRMLEDGAGRDPLGESTATVQDISGRSDTWVVLDLPPGTRADNLELRTQGPAELYEVEILADVAGTAVDAATWAQVKAVRPGRAP
ncbi:MAG: hypothetical protein ABIL09_01205 [Gemmatimonadota bacterium]